MTNNLAAAALELVDAWSDLPWWRRAALRILAPEVAHAARQAERATVRDNGWPTIGKAMGWR